MHREIQIKQFPIVTTHWWPKTWNERFVWENEQYLYFFTSCTQPCPSDLSAHTHPVCDVCVRQRLTEGMSEGNFSSANGGVSQSDRLMQIPNPVHATPEKYVIDCCNYDGASAPRFRHALHQALTPTPRVNAAWARARAHTRHTPDVCALRSLGHGCVQEVKNDINTVRFLTQTARLCLRPSMCSYDGELFNLDFSVHVLFASYRDSDLYLPLYDCQTRTVWPKNIKIGSTEEKKTPTSWMPLG